MRFSQKIGKSPIKTILQIESLDLDLKNRLWNVILEHYLDKFSPHAGRYDGESELGQLSKFIWKEFFKQPVDKIPKYSNVDRVITDSFISTLRVWYYKAEWFEIYDLVEFLALLQNNSTPDYINECNCALERELAGYRILDGRVIQITSEQELQAIQFALDISDKWTPVKTHLKTAVNLFSDKKSPDYRNSIKESISAVESLCKIIVGDSSASLGQALTEIEKQYSLHRALKSSFSSLYGYTSDSSGIRHALLESNVQVGFDDAKFMLISCSAFISYLVSKAK